MKNIIRHIISLILPVTVLIIIPYYLLAEFRIKNILLFVIGLILMLIGLLMIIITISSFNRIGKGTLAPWSPTKNLVTTGLYAYVRNPMISGVMFVLIGESIVTDSLKILLWATVFFIINNIYFRTYEEPDLERKFGEEYRIYKRNVPRWIPRLKPFVPGSDEQE